ncbi:putative WD repeat-containing protein C17D11.08 [Colletotrichum chlorophyti]|uniref:Putative WD repeat-containing protein C17D11.08 n=1 Tax=Colletotrichum chlorophyti TaxID=708187 RepID=A0A1Q8S6E0_9PEZI|nr:putative WD repeat-containing protein C17D11.08 [Colletotrichum chlorophyti]
MNFLGGHRRSASNKSVDPEQQQEAPYRHSKRLSASSALIQAAQALGTWGAPSTATDAAAITATNSSNNNASRPQLPNPGPPSTTSTVVSSHSQHTHSHSYTHSYSNPRASHLLPPPSSSPTLTSPQFVPGTGQGQGEGNGAASPSATATATATPATTTTKDPPVANFRWDVEYYDDQAIPDSASARSNHHQQPYSPQNHHQPQSSSYSSSPSASKPQFHHTRSQSYTHDRASVPASLLPANGQHRHSTYSLSAHSTTTETPGPPGLSPSVNSFPSPSSSSSVAAMNPQQQQQQQQQFPSGAPRRTDTYSSQHSQQGDELHMGGGMMQHGQLSPREYSSSSAAPAAPHIKLDQASPSASQYQNPSQVPNVLQPGGPGGRPPAITANTAPTLATMQSQQPQDYQTPSKPPSLSLSHSYSRSSPAAGYEGASTFAPYTPTTPSGSGSQFMSPQDAKYNAPGSQRNISNTPLGLADIRPRADSSMSDGVPGSAAYELANAQPGTSNYLAPWALYAFDWCKWPPQGNGAGKLAVGSYLEDGHNYIQILDTQIVPTPNDVYQPGTSKYNLEFSKVAEATHSYPVTRLLWEPPSSQKQSTDLLATSGDHLRLWSLPSETPSSQSNSIHRQGRDAPVTKLTPLALLSNSKTPDHTAPLTSLDWNTVSPSLIITSSIDTTCTIWDIPSLTAKTQLIAHDKEVYDVRFCANSVDVFVSCGQDGSVRMFDLRSLEHSTIIYEPTGKDDRVDANGGRISPTLAQQTMSNPPPLLRLATSPHDTHLLATFAQDSNVIRILDVRHPGQALLELRGHGGSLNSIEWSPTRRGVLASGADDCQVLLWDVYNNNHSLSGGPGANGAAQPDSTRGPYASWQCDYEVGNLAWVPHLANNDHGEWLGVSAGRGLWGIKTCGRTA